MKRRLFKSVIAVMISLAFVCDGQILSVMAEEPAVSDMSLTVQEGIEEKDLLHGQAEAEAEEIGIDNDGIEELPDSNEAIQDSLDEECPDDENSEFEELQETDAEADETIDISDYVLPVSEKSTEGSLYGNPDEIVKSGYCGGEGDGTNVAWTLDSEGYLTISGSGDMRESTYDDPIFSQEIRKKIKNIVITGNITRVTNLNISPYGSCGGFTKYKDAWYLGNSDNPYYVLYENEYVESRPNNTYYVHPDTHVIMDNAPFYANVNLGDYYNIIFLGNEELSKNMIINWNRKSGKNYYPNRLFHYIGENGKETTVVGMGYCGNEGDGTNIYWIWTPDGRLDLYGIGEMESYAINSSVGKTPAWTPNVSGRNINQLVIHEGITNVGDHAFINMNLAKVEVAGSVMKIGKYAFAHLMVDSLNPEPVEVILHEGVTSIGESAFESWWGANWDWIIAGQPDAKKTTISINLPSTLTEIGESAFYGWEGFSSIRFPDSLKKIGDNAFSYCDISSIVLPDGLKVLGNRAFANCKNLQRITVGTNIEDTSAPFSGCPIKILKFTFTEDGKKTIPSYIMYGFQCSVENIIIPNGIVAIGDYAFEKCQIQNGISIPGSVEQIGKLAFYESSLDRVTISKGVKVIGESAFENTEIKEIIIPNSVETIGAYAFNSCEDLSEVTIGADTIAKNYYWFGNGYKSYPFFGCPLTTLTILDGVSAHNIPGINGLFKTSDSDGNDIELLTVSSGIEKIDRGAFSFADNLKTLYLPDTVNTISVRCIDDGNPEEVDVYYPGTQKQWLNLNFTEVGEYSSDPLIEANIHFNEEDMESRTGILQQGEGWALKWRCWYYLNPYDNTKSRPWLEIFMEGTDLEDSYKFSVPMDNQDTSPWLTATGFSKTDFTKIKITGNAQNPIYIATGQFSGYSNIKTLTLSRIYGIGGSAFENCTSLQAVSGLDSSLYIIDQAAFRNDTALISIAGSASNLNTIGKEAFKGTDLRSITLLRNVSIIANDSFTGCNKLIIRCYKDSIAHQYAIANNIEVYLLDTPVKIRSDYNDDRTFRFRDFENIEDVVFEKPSTQYNPRLAHLLSVLARSAYTSPIAAQNYYNMGFCEDVAPIHYGNTPYFIGSKELDDGAQIVLITIRGTDLTKNPEQLWGDINVGYNSSLKNNGWHPYFSDTSEEVFESLKSYFNGTIPVDKTTYVITGHSLGGAAGNLLAMRLFYCGVPNTFVYNYNFASPNVAIGKNDVSAWNNNGNHSNIINICNDCEILPVPVAKLPDRFISTFSIDNILTLGLAGNVWGKYGVTYWYGGPTDHNIRNEIDYLSSELGEARFITTDNRVTVVGAFCPVDVVISDSSGNPLVSTNDNIPNYFNYEIGEKAIVLVNGDRKVFYLFEDDNYTINLTGTDTGTMDFVVAETDLSSGELYSIKQYEWIDLTDGKQMQSEVQGGESVEDVQLFVVDDSNHHIKEIDEIGDETTIRHTVSFDVEGYNVIPRPQTVDAGQKITEPNLARDDGYVVEGWYQDPEHTILWDYSKDVVCEDITLYASWSLAGFSIKGIEPDGYTYTGKAIIPQIEVCDQNRTLIAGKDYTISFKNNTNVASKDRKKNPPTITIKGKGNYVGQETETFSIIEKDIGDEDVTFSDLAAVSYNKNKAYKPVPEIVYNGKKLSKKDFEVAYYSDEACNTGVTPLDPGLYYAKITGKNNYTGSRVLSFVIADTMQIPVSKLTIEKIPDQVYNGSKWEVAPVIRDGKTGLNNEDYFVVEYGSNTEIGNGTVMITGKEGSKYVGTRTVTFKITGIPMNKVKVDGFKTSMPYNGSNRTQDEELDGKVLSLSYKAPGNAGETPVIYKTQDEYDALDVDEQKDICCIISYKNNINAGTATMTLTGIHGCSGVVTKTFKIAPYDITPAKDTGDQFTVDAGTEAYAYAKGGVKPKPVVKFNDQVLAEGVDYTLSYSNNSAINEANGNKKPTIKVTGKGNFKGSDATTMFEIGKAEMQTCGIKVVANDIVAQNKPGKWITKYSVVGPDGKALKAGTDYDKNVEFTNATTNEVIDVKDTVAEGTVIKIKVSGTGAYTGTAEGTYRILAFGRDISKLTASLDPKTYTGKAVTLSDADITWKSGGKKVDGVTFMIDPATYKNNLNKGKATVVVKGTGNYGGTKTITFTIGTKGILWWWRNLFN